ncbi:MAG TPA: adenylate/guanylate cyclase domain-containing protein, partial [Candidatus Ozemobacteraceae bacterium]|nr:adenylate/guanylate cyclase domain-containing protein [Candidatus Ozemobacteraceae bacterium]
AGSLLFAHLLCFGFVLPLRLRGKLLIGALFAIGVPLGILLPNAILQQRLQAERLRETIINRLSVQQHLLAHQFQAYMSELRLTLLQRAEQLRPVACSSFQLASVLADTFSGLPVQDVFGVSADRQQFHWVPPLTPTRDTSNMERTALLAMAQAFRLGSDPATRHQKPLVKVHGVYMNLTPVGDLLSRPGTIITSDMLAGKTMTVTGLPIPVATGAAAILVRFRPADLLSHFFATHHTLLQAAQENVDEWHLSQVALQLSSDQSRQVVGCFWEPRPDFSRPLIPSLDRPLRLGLNIDHQRLETATSTRLLTSIAIPNQPCLLVGCAETTVARSRYVLIWSAVLYLALLLTFIVLLLETVFRIPILFFHAAAGEIESGRYPSIPPVSGDDELGQLGDAFGGMIQGLRQRDAMSQFVSDEVLEAVQSDTGEGLAPGGELMPVTVLFVGLRGFKDRALSLPAADRLRIMNSFLDIAGMELKAHQGSLDKMIEDTIMGVFRPRGSPTPTSVRAVKAGLGLQKKLSEFWNSSGIACDIGIAHGTVLSGRIGSHHGTLDFSVIGNAVNLAARLKAAAKGAMTSGILIDPQAIRDTRGAVRLNFLKRTSIKGRSREFNLYEVTGLRDESPES